MANIDAEGISLAYRAGRGTNINLSLSLSLSLFFCEILTRSWKNACLERK